jgi:protein-disulfide isomerase
VSDVNNQPENDTPEEPTASVGDLLESPPENTEGESAPVVQQDELEAIVEAKRKFEEQAGGDVGTGSITVPRASFNYALIAIVFFALGGVMGSFVFPSQRTAELPENFEVVIREAVNDAIESAGLVEEPGLVMGDSYEVTLDISDDPFKGNPDAPVTIIEFSDFTCGFCGRFASETLDPLVEEYGDQVKVVYVDFPFLSQMSVPAALAAECADDQGEFWPMHDAIFANQRGLTPETLRSLAVSLELDMETYDTCFDEALHIDEIRTDLDYGRELGVSGTPAFFVNGTFVSGAQPIDVFRQIIDEELSSLNS